MTHKLMQKSPKFDACLAAIVDNGSHIINTQSPMNGGFVCGRYPQPGATHRLFNAPDSAAPSSKDEIWHVYTLWYIREYS